MYVYSSVTAVQRSIFESKNGPVVDEQLSAVYKVWKVTSEGRKAECISATLYSAEHKLYSEQYSSSVIVYKIAQYQLKRDEAMGHIEATQ